MFPPTGFIIGAQKSGTTFLASLLAQNPRICVSEPKETHYLTYRFEEGIAPYRAAFRRPGAEVLVDASTSYSFLRAPGRRDDADAPGLDLPVPERMRALSPGARIVYVLRHPADRAVSSLHHALRASRDGPGRVSLMELIERHPMVDLIGRYSAQIARYREVFPEERFLFLSFEALTADPQAAADACCAHFGVGGVPVSLAEGAAMRNAATRLTRLGVARARLARRMPGLVSRARAVLPEAARRRLRDAMHRPPERVEITDMAEARAHYAEECARVEALTGIRLA